MTRAPDFSTSPASASPARTAASWALGLAVLLLVWSGVATVQALRGSRADQGRLTELRREVEALRGRAASLEARQRGSGGDLLTSQLVLTAEAAPGPVLAELTALLPGDVRFDSLSFEYGSRLDIDASVVARRPAAYDVFLERLSGSARFNDVQPGPEVRESEMRSSVRMSYTRLP